MKDKFWMIETTAHADYAAFRRNMSNQQITEKQMNAYLEYATMVEEKNITVEDGIAKINISGILANSTDFYDFFFQTYLDSYPAVIAALNLAEKDYKVEQIQLLIDSPGGFSNGLFNLLDTIRSMNKPVAAIVTKALSAAYMIASVTDRIIATTKANEIGSLGVGVSVYVRDNLIDITNTDSPKKWPDAKTEEGKKDYKAELDAYFEKMLEKVSEGRSAALGRKISTSEIKKNFGQGAIVLSEQALEAGMIDEIQEESDFQSNADFFKNIKSKEQFFLSNTNKNKKNSGGKKEKHMGETLTAEKLLTDYPEVYKKIFGDGVESERTRVSALLKAGKNTNRLAFAMKCIAEKKSFMDAEVQAEFLTGKQNKQELNNYITDNPQEISGLATKEGGKLTDGDEMTEAEEKEIDKLIKSHLEKTHQIKKSA